MARALAVPRPVLPILGFELGFTAAVFALLLSLGVYVLLGLKQ